VKASDDDDGQFADITYKLMAGTSVFGIHAKKVATVEYNLIFNMCSETSS